MLLIKHLKNLQNWIFFFNLIFWLGLFCFLMNNFNIIQLLLLSEFCWVSIYSVATVLSGFTDDLLLLTITFLILGLAGLEFSLGFILSIVLSFFFKSNDLSQKEKKSTKKLEKQYNQNIKRYTSFL